MISAITSHLYTPAESSPTSSKTTFSRPTDENYRKKEHLYFKIKKTIFDIVIQMKINVRSIYVILLLSYYQMKQK